MFRNDAENSTRLVFGRGDASDVDCHTDGRTAERSRPGQYVLAAGAEMECTVQPGSYRYSAYTQRSGAVEQHKSKLRVR